MHLLDKDILSREDGALTSFGLFMLMGSMVIGGLALDVANAYMARTQLQATSDAVAHAAIYVRNSDTETAARTAGLQIAQQMMPAAKYGNTVTAADIQFGSWDSSAQVFTVDPGNDDAVWVDMSRVASRANPVATYFLSFAGINQWDVRRGSVFETYVPTCFREGFVAVDEVDMQSNNTFTNGFCIHSNDHVEVNIDNSFDYNVVVSMPDKRDIVEPSSANNPGLDSALRDGAYRLRIVAMLPTIMNDLYNGGANYAPDYITSPSIVNVTTRNVQPGDFTANRINQVNCVGQQKLRFLANNTFSDIVVITNCKIELGALVTLDNVLLATTNSASDSVISAAELQVGRDDNCAPDGGAQILTMGSISFPALLDVYGGQLIATGDISFTANADGIEGASFIAGGSISGTSNMIMGFCDFDGMERNFTAEYFRMAS